MEWIKRDLYWSFQLPMIARSIDWWRAVQFGGSVKTVTCMRGSFKLMARGPHLYISNTTGWLVCGRTNGRNTMKTMDETWQYQIKRSFGLSMYRRIFDTKESRIFGFPITHGYLYSCGTWVPVFCDSVFHLHSSGIPHVLRSSLR